MFLLKLFIGIALSSYTEAAVVLGDAIKRLECALKIQTGPDCPVDGSWSPWQPWETCHGECGQTGLQRRYRTCDNPAPKLGGLYCRGEHSETRSCQLPGCTPEQYETMVLGDPLRRAQYELVKAVHERFPALANRCLTNTCRYETVESVLQCGAMDYWISLLCVKHDVGCPVRGGWTNWGAWSPCSAICGPGAKFRIRSCTNPPPSSPEVDCQGKNFESQPCTGIACADDDDGTWGEWSNWSPCSADCGPGVRLRKRTCCVNIEKKEAPSPKITGDRHNLTPRQIATQLVQTMDADNRCSGPSEEFEECNVRDCDVDGGWSNWEKWSVCSAPCGFGLEYRTRSCNAPPPHGKGAQCVGPPLEMQHCYIGPCASKLHEVAVFHGDGVLYYMPIGQSSCLLHLYIRFMPLYPWGHLVRRHKEGCQGSHCNVMLLHLESSYLIWHVEVDGCVATAISEDKLDMDVWHDAMVTVTGTKITMRVDDAPLQLATDFNCIPPITEMDLSMKVGEQFQGHIKSLAVNFNTFLLRHKRENQKASDAGVAPYDASNVHYETTEGNIEEGFRHFSNGAYIEASCPMNEDHWMIEVAVKLESIDGVLLLMPGENGEEYTEVILEQGHIKLKTYNADLHSEVESPVEAVVGQWIYITVNRGGELRDGVCETGPCDVGITVNDGERVSLSATATEHEKTSASCKGTFYIGNIPDTLRHHYKQQATYQGPECIELFPSLSGMLGYLAIDSEERDISDLASLEVAGHRASSRTISFAEEYYEVPTAIDQQINLTCYYNREEPDPRAHERSIEASWLQLDTLIEARDQGQACSNSAYYFIKDNGRITHLTATSLNKRKKVEGFYECRVVKEGRASILVAYGVPCLEPYLEIGLAMIGANMVYKMKGVGNLIGIAITILGILALMFAILYLIFICCMCGDDENTCWDYLCLHLNWCGKPLSRASSWTIPVERLWSHHGKAWSKEQSEDTSNGDKSGDSDRKKIWWSCKNDDRDKCDYTGKCTQIDGCWNRQGQSDSEYSEQPILPPIPSQNSKDSENYQNQIKKSEPSKSEPSKSEPSKSDPSSSELVDITMQVGLFGVDQDGNTYDTPNFIGKPLSARFSPYDDKPGFMPDLEFDLSFRHRDDSSYSTSEKEDFCNAIIECQIPESLLNEPPERTRYSSCSCHTKRTPSVQDLNTMSIVGEARESGRFGEFVQCTDSDKMIQCNAPCRLSSGKMSEHLIDVDAILRDVQCGNIQRKKNCYR